jgi:hypothetical protein
MESLGIRQPLGEEGVVQERTLIKDKTPELKISSRPPKEMEVQLTLSAVSKRSTELSSK